MPRSVEKETLDHATKCRHGFECLNSEKWRNCSIEGALSGGLVVRDRCPQKVCYYSLYYGDSHYFCICPVRREIFQRYNI